MDHQVIGGKVGVLHKSDALVQNQAPNVICGDIGVKLYDEVAVEGQW